ncbi:MAG TPA: type II toxin-antitoxin system VapC family toxin [Caulobacteraceae bacterium]|jgi:predicted nucleic acid-binding protein
MFVVDASVALAILLGEAEAATARAVIARSPGGTAIAPAIWPLEVANALARDVRRGRLTPERALILVIEAKSWGVVFDDESPDTAFGATLELSILHTLTVYDASYLELCLRSQTPLATFDRDLASAAVSRGVTLLIPLNRP